MRFNKEIDANFDEMIRSLQGCIQIPSVYKKDDFPYGEPISRCLDYMLQLSGKLGFQTVNMDGVLGWAEYGEGDEMVAVLGHLDVVPEGDGWSVDPYAGQIIGDRIYGRGTMDDKGPVMAALYGLKAIAQAGVKLNRRVRILFGTNEESGSADMKYYKAHGGELPVAGFTPDGAYPLINGEKGLVTELYGCDFTQQGSFLVKELQGGEAGNIVPDKAHAVISCSPRDAEKVLALAAGMKSESNNCQNPAAMAGADVSKSNTTMAGADVSKSNTTMAGADVSKNTDAKTDANACTLAGKITATRTADGVRVEAEGINAHAASPWNGENAIGRLMLFMKQLPLDGALAGAVSFLADKIGMECRGESLGIALYDEISGNLSCNLGVVKGNDHHLEVKLNYRYPVTHTFEECGPAVRRQFEEVGFTRLEARHKERLYVPADAPLAKKLLEVYEENTGLPGIAECIGGGTYAKSIPNVLAFGPIFPGDEVREHKPDEYMELSRLKDNANIMADAIYALAAD